MRKQTKIFFGLLALTLLQSAALPAQVNTGWKINFDEGWRFHFGHASDPQKHFNYSLVPVFVKSGATAGSAIDNRFNDSSWKKLDLPHDWAVGLPFVNVNNAHVESHGFKPVGGLFPETSIGWYRKHFTVARADSGQRFRIEFDGVFRDANIWINGFYLGNNKSGYTSFSYDITDFINFEKDNVIAVRADATQYEGWFYEGAGIYRHVWLTKTPGLHIEHDGVFAYSAITESDAALTVETTLQNEEAGPGSTEVNTYLTDRAGKIVANAAPAERNVAAGKKETVRQQINFAKPIRWSTDNPYLYRVVVELRSNGKVTDKRILRFGFRTIEVKANGVFVNGKHVKLQGVNCHQDHAGVGSALPDFLQYYRIGLLKELGVNAYRTSHHAPTPELLDACDSLGMLVMDEQRMLNSGPEYIDQFERIIRRDRSRTSVFMWSIGNEEGGIQTSTTGKRIAQTFINKQQQLDPTRTCTYAADLANVYKGINEVIPVRSFNYRQFAVADYHKSHPGQPIIGTEMGSTVTTRGIYEKDSVRAYVPDQDIEAPWWASKAEDWWSLAAVNDFWLGGFVWTGLDYRGEPAPYKWPNINSHFGIMDMCGFPKNIYYYYQSWWTDKDVLHISPHWNWPDKQGKPIDVWVNSNADNIELFLNGQSLGKKSMPRNSHLIWQVNYQPGKLEAVAYKKGKKITAKIETTGPAAKLLLAPYKTTMIADGQDATIVNISMVDKAGREIPDAGNLIRFKLTGEAEIIGVGNGDPSSHEADKFEDGLWKRALFNGKCQVIIKSGKLAGDAVLEVKAEGFPTEKIIISARLLKN